jgi:hypothetical protein
VELPLSLLIFYWANLSSHQPVFPKEACIITNPFPPINQFPIANCILPIVYCILPIHHSPLTIRHK